jgi:hypothetical protein
MVFIFLAVLMQVCFALAQNQSLCETVEKDRLLDCQGMPISHKHYYVLKEKMSQLYVSEGTECKEINILSLSQIGISFQVLFYSQSNTVHFITKGKKRSISIKSNYLIESKYNSIVRISNIDNNNVKICNEESCNWNLDWNNKDEKTLSTYSFCLEKTEQLCEIPL